MLFRSQIDLTSRHRDGRRNRSHRRLAAFVYWYRRNRRLFVVPNPQRTVDPEAKVGNHRVGEVGSKVTELGYAYVIGGSGPNGGYAPPQLDAYNTGYAPP